MISDCVVSEILRPNCFGYGWWPSDLDSITALKSQNSARKHQISEGNFCISELLFTQGSRLAHFFYYWQKFSFSKQKGKAQERRNEMRKDLIDIFWSICYVWDYVAAYPRTPTKEVERESSLKNNEELQMLWNLLFLMNLLFRPKVFISLEINKGVNYSIIWLYIRTQTLHKPPSITLRTNKNTQSRNINKLWHRTHAVIQGDPNKNAT